MTAKPEQMMFHLHPAAVSVASFCPMTGPKQAIWKEEEKIGSYPNRTVFVRGTVLKKEETYNYSSDKSWRSVVLFRRVRSKSIFVNSIGIRLNGDMIRLV